LNTSWGDVSSCRSS